MSEVVKTDVPGATFYTTRARNTQVRRESIFLQINPNSLVIDESNLGYYIPNFEKFIRIPKISGSIYDTMDEEEKEYEKNRLRQAIDEGVDWIIIELREFQIEPQQLIAYSHHVHIFGSIAGLCSITLCYIFPNYRWIYIPFTIVNTISAVYYYIYSYRLVSQYEVEKDKVQLTRFPMKRFPRTTIVLRKQGNTFTRIRNSLTAGFAFLYTCYNIWNPPPHCVCKWKVLDILKEQELAKINQKYSLKNYI